MHHSDERPSGGRPARRVRAPAKLAAALMLLGSGAAVAETRGFVMSWFTVATYSQQGDCPQGENTFESVSSAYRESLQGSGRSSAEVEKIMQDLDVYGDKGYFDDRVVIAGQPANAWQNPTAARIGGGQTSLLHTSSGKYAFGFNLHGKTADQHPFEDPETHEPGVDNEYYRVVGCISTFRALPPARSLMGLAYQWGNVRASMPAILVRVTTEDFSKDGDATVIFDRAIEHAEVNLSGEVRAGSTFRADPDPRTHNIFHAKMVNHVLTITPGNFWMLANPYVVPAIDIREAHLRMAFKPNGTLEGIMGGFQPWLPIYWAASSGGSTTERSIGVDLLSFYATLKKFADAYPDPKTGQNTAISVAYRIEAVPAFVVDPDPSGTSGRGTPTTLR